ncbi:MAG: dCMP deaminase family protein [Alphaproteobacteria bacterium]|nr:dCMP deaminase family protein [Alphaproteobacteria bacterium]
MDITFSDKWNYRFMELALHISTWSKDSSTKVGCVIVSPEKAILSMGYNGFPRGVNDDISTRHERPTKYDFVVHAEENAILNAGRRGTRLDGGILYVTMPPCTRCAGSIIQSGIKEVVYLSPNEQKRIPGWRDNLKYSFEMFNESGVKVTELNRDLVNINMTTKFQNLIQKQK